MTANFNTLVATNQRHSVARGWTPEEDVAILKEKVSHDAVRLGILTKEDEKEFGIELAKANRHGMVVEAVKKDFEVTEEMTNFEIFKLINSEKPVMTIGNGGFKKPEEEGIKPKDGEFVITIDGENHDLTNYQDAKKFATEKGLEFAGNISKNDLQKLISTL